MVVLTSGAITGAASDSHGQTNSPIVAVFAIQDRTGRIAPSEVQELTEYLAAKLAERAVFQVLPNSQLKERLIEQKKESYRDCYDAKCQIEIGRELAAQKSLSTQISAFSAVCAVTATLYDLKRATSEAAASEKGGCGKDEIAGAIERVANAIKDQVTRTALVGPSGGLLIKTTPAGADVSIDGSPAKGKTPLFLRLGVGDHVLHVMTSKGGQNISRVLIKANEILDLTINLEAGQQPAPAGSSAPQPVTLQSLDLAVIDMRKTKARWGYAAIGIGAASLVTAVVLYGVGFRSRNEADARYMATKDPVEMDRHWADVEAADRKIVAGHVVLSLAAAAAAFAVYEFVSRPRGKPSTISAVAPQPRVGSAPMLLSYGF